MSEYYINTTIICLGWTFLKDQWISEVEPIKRKDVWEQLNRRRVFSIEALETLGYKKDAAYKVLQRLVDQGMVRKIRNGLYATVNVETGEVNASVLQIACGVHEAAFLSHQSALVIHGLMDWVDCRVFYGAPTKVKTFSFEGWEYVCIPSGLRQGVEIMEVPGAGEPGLPVTSLERTLVESLRELDRVGGVETMTQVLKQVDLVDEEELLFFMDHYSIQMLYQKAGFMLTSEKERLGLSEGFFEHCKSHMGSSVRYLNQAAREDGVFVKEWQLVVTSMF